MITLQDLFDPADLEAAIADGYVRVQSHPTLPLRIFNYTPKAMFRREWTPVTRQCRGLIADESGLVVARPFPKFFGVDDPLGGVVNPDEPVTVTDKLDGALAILYPTGEGEFAVATRGSFASEPALHATEVWQDKYAGRWEPAPGMTALFEILYPGWRIVIDYKGMDDLALLAFVDIATGRSYSPLDKRGWPGPIAEVFPYRTYMEALAAEPRPDAEGLVVHFLNSDIRKKLKYAEYVARHRLMFSLTTRRLWTHMAVQACKDTVSNDLHWQHIGLDPADAQEALAVGSNWLEALIEDVPDEFFEWIRSRVDGINQQVVDLRNHVTGFVDTWKPLARSRQEFWEVAADDPSVKAMLMCYDGQDLTHWLWRAVRPEHETPFRQLNEDVA